MTDWNKVFNIKTHKSYVNEAMENGYATNAEDLLVKADFLVKDKEQAVQTITDCMTIISNIALATITEVRKLPEITQLETFDFNDYKDDPDAPEKIISKLLDDFDKIISDHAIVSKRSKLDGAISQCVLIVKLLEETKQKLKNDFNR